MSIQQGNYLKELRVKNGLSQEKLAERLGVSRQSVSKWEQGYAVPSSDNVLELSKLYGISADNILNCEVPQAAEDEEISKAALGEEISKSQKSQQTDVLNDAVAENEHEIKSSEKHKKHSWLFAAYPCIAVFVTLALGAFDSALWKTSWIFLLTIPLYYTGSIAIRKKNPLIFCYPAVVIIVYLLCGFYAGLWHPLWILFATIPIYYIASGYAYKNHKRK